MLPNFLIIGAPRAGTTWLAKIFYNHPDIYIPFEKELHFFDKHYEKGLAYYESFFEGRKEETAVGEATPDYLSGIYSKYDVPSLIKQHLPNVKLIVSLRNPVERVYSRYLNARAKYPQNANLTFEEKLRQKPEFIEEGFYYDQLLRYYKLFPSEQILVILFDEITDNPKEVLCKIYRFLDVNPNFECGLENVKVNTSAGKVYLGRSRMLWYFYKVLFHLKFYHTADLVLKANSTEQPQINPATKKMLVEAYREKNLQLQDLIGRDLDRWNEI